MQAGRNYLKVNDQVEVIAGKDKGRVGKIQRIISNKNKAVVEKINIVKRHTKPNQNNQQGGIIDVEAPVHVSNLMLVCNKCAKPRKIATKILDDGEKTRVCKKCGETIEPKG
jgi:large subunit ribosomal protein L24